ncbi:MULTISPECIES: class I SAM-dependent methyltransferase [unclassified Amycolatopsis]|uniref:class I SAM-dependent methyltransferase n=1 Tax=unclassified Amycolatopsis TaxID=2618356 RepID=UPI002875EC61|nr:MULTISPECIES: class I SAM-dependent methyltransferase [unclassified Amycolatopsis]MDS0134820.1 class I SAM-dependent methyltransferase [Amycolatopsis sp. 505]MDS0148004.1 class I SAM-dependent methyltransferase [Amycolatopsis sp. CM201R]
MSGYDALAEVYEWLISEAKLAPAEFAASFEDVLGLLPPNAHVLDCSCGTGQLAVGLAGLGMHVVATDASEAMVRRTAELSEEFKASVRTMQADWQELPDHFDDDTFDVVFCVGNSLHHAKGARGRVAALESMARLLRRGGRLVLTSRTWELVRARGSRLDIGDRLVRRNGRDAVVVYRWDIAPNWEDEHHIEIAIAEVDPAGSVRARSELLSSWPYRYEELEVELYRVGLRTELSTFSLDAENYTVVASKV